MAPPQLAMSNGAPSPAPSNASNSKKRKRWETMTPAKPLPADELRKAAPQDVLTQLEYTTRFLIEKKTPMTFDEITQYLSIQRADPEQLEKLKSVLRKPWNGSKIDFDPSGANGKGTYAFKPKIPVTNAEELLRHLQRQTDSIGLKMDDLKDGWKEYSEEIEDMETAKELLVVRNNKGLPRTIWQDDPTMNNKISDALTQRWFDIRLPANSEDMRTKLESAGLRPTSQKKLTAASRPQVKKKRAERKGGRQTNTHMAHVLKDYSEIRK